MLQFKQGRKGQDLLFLRLVGKTSVIKTKLLSVSVEEVH